MLIILYQSLIEHPLKLSKKFRAQNLKPDYIEI